MEKHETKSNQIDYQSSKAALSLSKESETSPKQITDGVDS